MSDDAVVLEFGELEDAVTDGIECYKCGTPFDEDTWGKRSGFSPGHAFAAYTCPDCGTEAVSVHK